MAQVQIDDFLTPNENDPNQRPPSAVSDQLKQLKKQPDSPSKMMARNRLGNLLGQIRKGDGRATRTTANMHGRHVVVVGGANDEQIMEETDIDVELDGRLGGRRAAHGGKRMRREKRVVFELRGKAFGLRDSGQPESVYALCRKWMYGRDDQPAMTTAEQQQDELEEEQQQLQQRLTEEGRSGAGRPPPFAFGAMGGSSAAHPSLDLMATKDIYALPPPRSDAPPLLDLRPQWPVRCVEEPQQRMMNNDDQPQMGILLDDHLQHWKKVKQNWRDYSRKREQRYADSLQLLRTVYGIAQQTQQI